MRASDNEPGPPDYDAAFKIIWTSMQISQTVFEYSFVEVDDAFEAEDKNEDGFLSRPELGRGLKTLGIKLQTEEVKRVFGLVDPAGTKQVDYNQFGGELYRRIGEMRGVERERLEEDTAARRKRLGRGVTVRVPGVGEATGLPDGGVSWQLRLNKGSI